MPSSAGGRPPPRDQTPFEVEHQPLAGQRVDADEAVTAKVILAQHRQFQLPHGTGAERQAFDLDLATWSLPVIPFRMTGLPSGSCWL